MKRKSIVLLLAVLVSLLGLAVAAQEGGGALNIAFIFDASGSMMAGMEGRTRLAVAQDAMAGLTSGLPANANASLWVYGHRLSQADPAASCQDIEEVIPLGPLDVAQFEAAVRGINAIGYTPITTSLQLAAQTLVDRQDARNTIVLISDGEETCGGSPCLMAQALKQANIELTVNTIGFAADDVTREQLECIADVTGGTYYDAPDAAQLQEALVQAVAIPGSVQLVDQAGNTLWEVAFRLEAADTGEVIGEYQGTATVPAGDYRVVVAIDPQFETTVSVTSDENSLIVVDLPEATGIVMVNLAGEPLPDLSFSLVDPATGETLYGTGDLDLPPGDYHVAVNTAFVQEFDVAVPDGVRVRVPVDDAAGVIRIVNLAGEPLPEMNFNVTDPVSGEVYYGQGEMLVPPGVYPVDVRTAFPTLAEATVADDQTVDVPVNDAAGVIRIVNLAGDPLPDMAFSITDPVTGEVYYGQGEMAAPPNTYPVAVRTVFETFTEATVTDGETVDVPVDTAQGTIVLTDLFGEPLADMAFNIVDPRSGETYYAQGQMDAPPGTYTLNVDSQPPVTIDVTLADGQVLEVPVNAEVGTLRLVTPSGELISDVGFNITDTSTGEVDYATGEYVLPPGEYSVEVQWVFPFETAVTVQAGEVTDITLDNALGSVQLVDEDGQPLNDLALELFREDGQSVYGRGPQNVPPGDYHLQVQTGIEYQTDVAVKAGETLEVIVPDQGTLRLVDTGGEPIEGLLFNAENVESGQSLAATGSAELPPGDYRVTVYTVFGYTVDATVTAGQTTDIVVDTALGTLQLVDANGAPLDTLLFNATRNDTGESTAATGSAELPPGDYTVTIYTTFSYDVQATITAGETTEIVVDTAAGTLKLVDASGEEIEDLLFSAERVDTGESTAATGSAELPPGDYTVTIFTVFSYEVEVTLNPGETTEIVVDTALGTLQLVDAAGEPLDTLLFSAERVDTGESTAATGSAELPPGDYTVTIYTVFLYEVEATINPGETTEIVVDTAAGTIRMANARGEEQESVLFTIELLETGDTTSATGEIEVPPGIYAVRVLSDKPFEIEVEVVADEVTLINVFNQSTDRPAP